MTNEEFLLVRSETVPKVALLWRDMSFDLVTEWLDDGVKWLCKPDGRYRTAKIYFSLPAIREAETFPVRTLILHEVIHTYFCFYKDFIEDLSPSVSMNTLWMVKNACLYQEEQIVEELAKKYHETYWKEERDKNKCDYWLYFTK